jgi:MFS family permease
MADPSFSTQQTAAPPAPGAEDEVRAGSRSALFIVFLVVLIDLLGFGIVLPLLPLYGELMLEPLFPGDGYRSVRGALLGLLLSVFSLMQFIFAPLWGRISDRRGRRPILLLGLTGSVLFYTMFGVASEVGARGGPGAALAGLILLFLARIGAGVAGATISTAQAVIADCTTKEGRSRGMALLGMAFGIGFTFGPLLSAASLVIPSRGGGAPGFAAAAFSLIALVLAVALLPETLRTGVSGLRRRLLDWRGLVNALRTPTIGLLITTFFLATLAFGGLESSLALVNVLLIDPQTELTREAAEEALRSPAVLQENLFVFAYVGFVLMLAQGFLYRRLVRRVGEVPFLRIGVGLMVLGLGGAVVVLLARRVPGAREAVLLGALVVVTLGVVGFACVNPSIQALISRRTDPAKQGEVLGANQSASALARILGPALTLPLFFLTASHVLPFLGAVALLVIVFCLALRLQPD